MPKTKIPIWFIHTHIHMCMCIQIYKCMCMYVRVCTYVCIYVCLYGPIYVYVYNENICVYYKWKNIIIHLILCYNSILWLGKIDTITLNSITKVQNQTLIFRVHFFILFVYYHFILKCTCSCVCMCMCRNLCTCPGVHV